MTNAKGADLSHWQDAYQFDRVLGWADFVALNACDGSGYRDPTFPSRWKVLHDRIGSGRISGRIAYLFLEPGDGAAQARLLMSTVAAAGGGGVHSRFALDWESRSLSYPWVLTAAANELKRHGHTPLVYCSSSQASRARAAAPNCPYWLADWTPPYPPNWAWTFLQYSGSGLDLDEFDGDRRALDKWFGHEPPPPPPNRIVVSAAGHRSVTVTNRYAAERPIVSIFGSDRNPNLIVDVRRVGQPALAHPPTKPRVPAGKRLAVSNGVATEAATNRYGAAIRAAKMLSDRSVQAVWIARADQA